MARLCVFIRGFKVSLPDITLRTRWSVDLPMDKPNSAECRVETNGENFDPRASTDDMNDVMPMATMFVALECVKKIFYDVRGEPMNLTALSELASQYKHGVFVDTCSKYASSNSTMYKRLQTAREAVETRWPKRASKLLIVRNAKTEPSWGANNCQIGTTHISTHYGNLYAAYWRVCNPACELLQAARVNACSLPSQFYLHLQSVWDTQQIDAAARKLLQSLRLIESSQLCEDCVLPTKATPIGQNSDLSSAAIPEEAACSIPQLPYQDWPRSRRKRKRKQQS